MTRWKRLAGEDSGGVFRNMLTLASGGLAAKAIGALSVPVITRIYSPDHMGILSAFTSLVILLWPFTTLSYAAAIPIPRRSAVSMNLFALNLSVLFACTLIVGLLLFIAGTPILTLLSLEALIPYSTLLVVAIFSTGLYEILRYYGIRKKVFGVLARSQASQATAGNITKVALGFLGLKPLGLIIGQILQQGGGIVPLLLLWIKDAKKYWRKVRVSTILKLAVYFRDFPIFQFPSNLLLRFSIQAPLLFSAQLFGMGVAGQLGLAINSLSLATSLLGMSTGQAYFAEISAIGRNNPNEILRVSRSVARRLLLLSLPPAAILFAAGPWLFRIAFGDTWEMAGNFARILAIYLMTQFVSSPLMNALVVFKRQNLLLTINLVRSVLVTVIFLTAIALKATPEHTLIAYSALLSIHYLLANRAVFGVIRKQASLVK
jgi:O-antigen/teichoic acid export membrane protein